MDLDVSILDDVVDRVEEDVMPLVQPYVQKAQQYIPGL